MQIDKDQIVTVLYRHCSGQPLNEQERALLEQWLQQSPANQEVFAQIQDEKELDRYLSFIMDEQHTALAFEAFKTTITNRERAAVRSIPVVRTAWFRYTAAAVLLFAVCSLWFVIGRRGGNQPDLVQIPAVQDVSPGRSGAVLTLADGKTIVLDSLGNGIVAEQDGRNVELKEGTLNYEATHSPLTTPTMSGQADHSLANNTLQTPRGRQFQLVLPDGTKVWLNAASSITYPVAFTGKERNVKITGEAYFEVSKNKEKPFIVDVDGRQTVEVLGTHFNVNSYGDDGAIRTTLLEGKVKVVNREPVPMKSGSSIVNNESVILQPGEQAVATTNHKLQTTNQISIDQIMAWKNGLFNFNGADLKTVLQQLSRWYDVDIVYEGNISPMRFVGEIGRDLNLLEVLEALQRTDVHFRIEGKKLVIMP